MMAYSFVGAFLHFSGLNSSQNNIDCENDGNIDIKEIMDLYNKLTRKDIMRIKTCPEVM